MIRGYIHIMVGAAFWGISATIAKFLFNNSIDPLIIVQTRVSFAFVVLFLVLLTLNRPALKIEWSCSYKFALLGILGIAGPNVTYYYAIKLTSVATAILLQYTVTVMVMLYGILILKESNTWYKWMALILSLAGCYFAVGGLESAAFHTNKVGLILGLLSAVTFAFLNIYGKVLSSLYTRWSIMVFSFGFASLFWLLVNPPWKILAQNYSFQQWLIFIGFSMISILIPYIFYFLGLKYLQASRVIIISTLEPIVAILSAFLILGELMSPFQILGGVMVIGAIILLQTHQE